MMFIQVEIRGDCVIHECNVTLSPVPTVYPVRPSGNGLEKRDPLDTIAKLEICIHRDPYLFTEHKNFFTRGIWD